MSDWQPIETAPRDGTQIIIFHKIHGQLQAWFSPGEWSEETPVTPREYSGAAWVIGDDLAQEEVEEFPRDAPIGPYDDGSITHWMPLPEPPKCP